MLDLTPLTTKDYFAMPEHIRRKEYFLNWHKYLCLKADKAIAKADIRLGGPPMRKRKRSIGMVKDGAQS